MKARFNSESFTLNCGYLAIARCCAATDAGPVGTGRGVVAARGMDTTAVESAFAAAGVSMGARDMEEFLNQLAAPKQTSPATMIVPTQPIPPPPPSPSELGDPFAFDPPNNHRPSFLSLPDRVRGTPSIRDNFPFAAEIPTARFHENENPNFLPILQFFMANGWSGMDRFGAVVPTIS